MSDKIRIDIFLHENRYYDSREKAKRAIMAGDVYVDGNMVDKAGTKIDASSLITIKEKERFVSRGGYKLEKALQVFKLDLKHLTCMDIGASTGGFTDCMLQSGAKKVYAVDVGYGQLEWKLRNDPRVEVVERTNFRKMNLEIIQEAIDFFCIDVSFISLMHIFPNVVLLGSADCQIVSLIKPQFEAGREKVGKHGIVRDKATHIEVINKVISYANNNGLYCKNLTFSPIKGGKGNIEYLAVFDQTPQEKDIDINDTVNVAFLELNN
jgi:23S rRNA (cytidine1920-2'-O)/16S rRNA (cytidine1409-2'-O)-methyltransferase